MPQPKRNVHFRIQVATTTRSNVSRMASDRHESVIDAIKAAQRVLEQILEREIAAEFDSPTGTLAVSINISRRVRYYEEGEHT